MLEQKEKLSKIALSIDEQKQLVINKISKFIKEPIEENLNLILSDVQILDAQILEFKKCIMEIIRLKVSSIETPETEDQDTISVDVISTDQGLKII